MLRDSHHAGVAYGKFDHHRLIESIRILPETTAEGGSQEPSLGVDIGGLHSAEALLLARYFMWEQVYCHPVRRIYDIHLKEFMLAHFGDEKYPLDLEQHIATTDNEILVEIADTAREPCFPGHGPAKLILNRSHFRRIYSRNMIPPNAGLEPAARIFSATEREFGAENVRFDTLRQKSDPTNFPVLVDDGTVRNSREQSPDILGKIPLTAIDFIFCAREVAEEARQWIAANQVDILKTSGDAQ